MRALWTSVARRVWRGERGFTMIELVFTCAVLALVVVAIASLGETTQKHAPRDQERAHVIRDAQVGLHQMTRELRHASAVNSYGPKSMDVVVSGTNVVFDCNVVHPQDSALRRCVRTVGATSRIVVDRVVNEPTVFTYDAARHYAQVRIEVPAKGEVKDGHKHKVVLDDGVYLRNVPDAP